MTTILLVDDEPRIIELTQLYLEREGYAVVAAHDGVQALAMVQGHTPDLIVLDLMLPGLDGWEVCKRVRAESDTPIIMLTARTDDIDKIVGLELGADDYMTKPFNPRELVARIKAVLRRARTEVDRSSGSEMSLGNLTLDAGSREVRIDGRQVALRIKEFDLLNVLARHAGLVLTREQLLNQVWDYDFYGDTRTVDVHIAHLRSKLSGASVSIETVWGIGYKLVA